MARGWTAVSGPAKPAVAQLATMNLAQPELSDAPTSAMLRGAKNARSRSGVTSSRAAPWLAGPGCRHDRFGSFGRPRARSPMMFRWISLVPE